MDGKEAIVGKILSDAEERAAGLTAAARKRADAMKADAERAAAASLAEGRRVLEEEAAEIVARRETVAALDNRKTLLAAKRAVIDEVLSGALAMTCAFDKPKYLEVLGRLLDAYAEEGDAVTLSASAPVREEELTACKAFAAKKLRYAGRGEFEGGLRLENAVCVKDLSFGALLEAHREALEREIADTMFPTET